MKNALFGDNTAKKLARCDFQQPCNFFAVLLFFDPFAMKGDRYIQRVARDELDLDIAHFRLARNGTDKILAKDRSPGDRAYCRLLAKAVFGARLTPEILTFTKTNHRPLIPPTCVDIHAPRRSFPSKPCKRLYIEEFSGDFYLSKFDHHAFLDAMAIIVDSGFIIGTKYNAHLTTFPKTASVCWRSTGHSLALGCNDGSIQLYDAEAGKQMPGIAGVHTSRVGRVLWRDNTVVTASCDKMAAVCDIRSQSEADCIHLRGHAQEVCGLALSENSTKLATGGNDNAVATWDLRNWRKPLHMFRKHTAGVKAIAWKPGSDRILATGGGIKDGHIHVWDAATGAILQSVESNAQVTSLHWPAHNPGDIVSSHGYGEDRLCVWSYPSMAKLVSLRDGYSSERILDAAPTSDQQTVITLSEYGTMNFWKVWPSQTPSLESRMMRTIR